MLVAAVCSVSVLALLAAVAPGANRTALVGWFAPAPYASQWMQPQMPMQEMGPRLVQLAAQNVPRQLAAALPAAQGAGRSSDYIDGLGSTAATLEEQKKALDARKQQIEQQEQDVQHLYEAAVQAREENTARRAEEEQAAVSRDAQVHGLPWQQEMGTDISFIPTAQFPGSMKGAWHHNAPYVGGQGAQALPPAALASPPPPAAASLGANSPTASAALQLAVKEKVDLDAAKAEIKTLKSKLQHSSSKKMDAPAASSAQGVAQAQQTQQRQSSQLAKVDSASEVHPQAAKARQFARKNGQQLRMFPAWTPSATPWRRANHVFPVRVRAAAVRPVKSAAGADEQFSAVLKRFLAVGEEHGLVSPQAKTLLETPKVSARTHVLKADKMRALGNIKSKVVKGNQKSLFDYNLDSDAEEGEEVWPYKDEATKGSPCSVPGACNHHMEEDPHFTLQDDEFHAKRLQDRFKEDEEEEEPEEVVNLGDSQVGGSFDDYVPPEDAYVHNLLTSSAPGIDHFGHLAPLSKANQEIMYGPSYHTLVHNVYGHSLHSKGRGGLSSTQAEEDAAAKDEDAEGEYYHDLAPAVQLGDDQIGGHDEEVPIALSMPKFPGSDPDHFDHWAHDDPKNQELLNGAYWKYMKKDGITDRLTPATEAYSQQKAGSHDRTLADTWGSVPHYYGFETAGGFDEAREMAHGQDWRDRVFTGTDESVEDHKGTHGSDTEFFKGKDPTLLKRSSASP
eukprot:Tamp_08552.p1 GENE.Tamp_08552~~Tamp_08552.p1  ORF type:complete len:754 (+),score=210.96 Tamp_08552:66-2264(+)